MSTSDRAIKGDLAPAAQRVASLKNRPDHPKAVDMVRELVHEELGPDRAEQLAEEIIQAAHRHHGEAATDPATLMEFAKEQLVKEAVEREGAVKRHTLAAKVQSVTDKMLDTEHHGTPLVAKKVLEKMQEKIHKPKEE